LEEEEVDNLPAQGRTKAKAKLSEEDELEMALYGVCSCSAPKPSVTDNTSKPTTKTTNRKEVVPKPSVDMTKNLDNVIAQQKASGCFNALALQLLDIPESAMKAKPTALPDGVDAQLADDIWITLLVLIGLEKKFGNVKSEWSLLAKKSEKWASCKLGSAYDTWKKAAETAF